jgi:hypothetical protein
MSLNSFSQTGTNNIDTTKVVLSSDVAKKIIKDLIKGDACQEELKLSELKIEKLKEINSQKDTMITLYREKDKNFQFIVSKKDEQLKISDELTKKLHKELKAKKRQSVLFEIGTIIGGLAIGTLLITR